MEQILENQPISGKVYKERAIWVGTFLGGPLVAGYLIAENFKVFHQNDRVKKTWIYSIIATIVIFGVAFAIPDNIKIPKVKIIDGTYIEYDEYLKRQQNNNSNDQLKEFGDSVEITDDLLD